MNLVQRVQDILLKPKETWPQIASEPGDATSLYKDYLIYLALVPAVAGFIGLIGRRTNASRIVRPALNHHAHHGGALKKITGEFR